MMVSQDGRRVILFYLVISYAIIVLLLVPNRHLSNNLMNVEFSIAPEVIFVTETLLILSYWRVI